MITFSLEDRRAFSVENHCSTSNIIPKIQATTTTTPPPTTTTTPKFYPETGGSSKKTSGTYEIKFGYSCSRKS